MNDIAPPRILISTLGEN